MGQEHKAYTWNLIAKRLSGEATPEELRELEELLRCNPELHYPMQTIADCWNSSSREDQKMAEQAFSRHLDRMKELNIDFSPHPSTERSVIDQQDHPPVRLAPGRRSLLLAASIGALIAISATWLYSRHSNAAGIPATNPTTAFAPVFTGKEVYTSNGSRTHLVLPDGSVVWLNAGSRINYAKNFGETVREVTLTGEAFFDVAANARKPFVIHTARINIRVLGTSFNVKSYPSDRTTEATLIRGSIEISVKNRPTDKIIMRPNEKLVIANEDSIILQHQPQRREIKAGQSMVALSKPTYEPNSGAIVETSWVDNKLIFQDEQFSELAIRLERWYGVTIAFTNTKEQELRFTGIFQHETIEQALEALKLTASFNYSIKGTQINIHGK